MLHRPRFLLTLLLGALASSAAFADGPTTMPVWPAAAPGEPAFTAAEVAKTTGGVTRIGDVTVPTLTIYPAPADKNTGAAVMVCPGGGYSILAIDLEGSEVAQWLNSIGVNAIVLKYRVPVRKNLPRYLPPLQDAQRAMSLIRKNAADWKIDPNRIGMLGFSAGGNLTAIASTNYDKRSYATIDDTDAVSCRPDFAVLVYPAWLVNNQKDGVIDEVKVTKQTPQMFIAQATDDPIDPESSLFMYLALKRAKVSAELHLYSHGGHGFGLRPSANPCATWPARCAEWMNRQGLLKPSTKSQPAN